MKKLTLATLILTSLSASAFAGAPMNADGLSIQNEKKVLLSKKDKPKSGSIIIRL